MSTFDKDIFKEYDYYVTGLPGPLTAAIVSII